MSALGIVGLVIVIYSLIKIAVAVYHLWKEKRDAEQ
jgi:preprotein translocase subunit SecF